MKAFATGMLVGAAIVYLVARANEDGAAAWVGYVRAGAEAAMVGALADWFAVTALFRHPLGLPIPHTAIIPKRKDQIGRSLGEFVAGQLPHPRGRSSSGSRASHVGQRLGRWLAEPAHAERAPARLADAMRGAIEVLDDRTVQERIGGRVERRLRATEVAPLLGKAIDVAVEGGHHQRLLDAVMTGLVRLPRRQPGDVAPAARQGVAVVGARADRRSRLREDLRRRAALPRRRAAPTRDHEVRASIEAPVRRSPIVCATTPYDRQGRGAQGRSCSPTPRCRRGSQSLWGELKRSLIGGGRRPDSELRRRLTDG